MTKIFRIWIVLGIASTLIVSCSSFNVADANKFQKGMSPEQVEGIASNGPKKTVTFKLPAESTSTFTALVFDLSIGSASADYFAVFENNKLLYWGHPYEFNRYPDSRMNAIGKAAVEAAD
ncbi:MAG: hypothetical protein NTX15_02330 [Candidatus Kapabacteria bacterium]|nr:hypothetical protein [Candidatus Kapabacteria bacterium]